MFFDAKLNYEQFLCKSFIFVNNLFYKFNKYSLNIIKLSIAFAKA